MRLRTTKDIRRGPRTGEDIGRGFEDRRRHWKRSEGPWERTMEVDRGSGEDIGAQLKDRNIRSLWFSRQELALRQEYCLAGVDDRNTMDLPIWFLRSRKTERRHLPHDRKSRTYNDLRR
jgi:hypothetical protein